MMHNHEVSMEVLEHVVGGLWGYNAEEHTLYSGIFTPSTTGIKGTAKEKATTTASTGYKPAPIDYQTVICADTFREI